MITSLLLKLSLLSPIFAACGPLGCVTTSTAKFTDLGSLIGLLIKIAVAFAGLWAMIQMILAGYMYLGSAGDPKKAEMAWWRLMYSILGLVVITAALLAPPIIARLTGQTPGTIPTN